MRRNILHVYTRQDDEFTIFEIPSEMNRSFLGSYGAYSKRLLSILTGGHSDYCIGETHLLIRSNWHYQLQTSVSPDDTAWLE